MSRVKNTGKNFVYSILSKLLSSVISFVSRTVFIKTLGATYLGANGLFTNILSMLSLTELGFGVAIAFSLYAPLAQQDTETIKSLMQFYKKVYRIIALVIGGIGLCLVPLLPFLIKDPGDMEHIPFIYLVFLYNTVVSYLFTYQTTLLQADQKGYIMTNVVTVINVITVTVQSTLLIVFRNYFVYLIVGAVINTVQWFFVNRIIAKQYPYIRDKDVKPLDKNIKHTIFTNVKAMVFHKFGEIAINQTDNIIISSFISVATVGIYDNYHMMILIIKKFANSFFNSATASLGNLIATETKEMRYVVFKRYNFLGFWVYGWTGICLFVLLNPFIELWIGKEYLLDTLTLSLIMFDYYLVGMRTTIGNVKSAAGLYSQDQWVPIIQAIINLSVSIVAAIYIGLPGVFLGTVVSGLLTHCWYRPVLVYRHVFEKPVTEYFVKYVIYFATTLGSLFLVLTVNYFVVDICIDNAWLALFAKAGVCLIIPNAVNFVLYCRTSEFAYLVGLAKSLLRRNKA